MRKVILVVLLLFAISSAASTRAEFTWGAVEEPPAGGPGSAFLAPDGVGLLFGFPSGGNSLLAVRPPDGPVGSPQDLPGTLGYGSNVAPFAAFAPSGDALIGAPNAHAVAFRLAGRTRRSGRHRCCRSDTARA